MSTINPDAFELESACYHHRKKGCIIDYYPLPKQDKHGNTIIRKDKVVYINKAVCKSHQAILCNAGIYKKNNHRKKNLIGRCKWERGLHYGQMSEGYKSLS